MRLTSFLIAAALIVTGLPGRAASQPTRGAFAQGTIAITSVNVIPMTSDTLLHDMTVLVRDGRIAEIGPAARVRVPAGAQRIDGRSRYLMPGLTDMHTHLYADDPATPDSIAPAELGVMIANGITTARLMIGTPQHLVLRREIAAGRVLGPQLWVASPQFTGQSQDNSMVVATPSDARAAVDRAVDEGYDFIKLTTQISRPVYDAVDEQARKRGIRVVGHVDLQVGVARAIQAGQQIEHLDGYLESVLADSAPMRVSVSNYGLFRLENWKSLDFVDNRKVDQIAGATARGGVWTTPTLTIFNTAFALHETDDAIRSRADWQMITPEVRRLYLGARTRYWSDANAVVRTEARRRRYVEVRNRLTKAIHDSGGKILAGSDTPEWFHVYGWALHRELESLVTAGLTPYQALVAATRNPAEYLRASMDWGAIEVGKRADLVLLRENPLANIRATTGIEGVSLGGRWLARSELDALIARGAVLVSGTP